MARPREFDIEAAISDAMDVFWEKGYEGASLPDLLKGMKIARGSLYKAFYDKKSLFMKVLARYDEEAVLPAVSLLSDDNIDDGWTRITTLFSSVVSAVQSGDRRGCVVCSAAAGPASDDIDIAKAVHRSLGKMRDAFGVALAASPNHAHLGPSELQSFSDTLTTQYIGLRVLARSNASIATLERSTKAIRYLAVAGN